jgi:hypothetical protein
MEKQVAELEYSDFVQSTLRILIVLAKFEKKKSFKMTLDKIMLFDFYMKFPRVMLPREEESSTGYSFEDHYSFYHWKPDRQKYHGFINYLLAKKLINRTIKSNEFCYEIQVNGMEALDMLRSNYFVKLNEVADFIKRDISTASESKIEDDIITKIFKQRNLFLEEGGVLI